MDREVKKALEIPYFVWGKEKWPNLIFTENVKS